MRQIVLKHYPSADQELVNTAMGLFYKLRDLGLDRSPSTRELLNWLKYLQTLDKNQRIDSANDLKGLGALIKTEDDMKKVQYKVLGRPISYN